jgi:hypothetical protein
VIPLPPGIGKGTEEFKAAAIFWRQRDEFNSDTGVRHIADDTACESGLVGGANRLFYTGSNERAGHQGNGFGRTAMDESSFNMAVRKFLKEVGVTSQREIERIVRDGKVEGPELKLRMTLTAENAPLKHVVEQTIDLR